VPRYRVDPARSQVVVCARSSLHDTRSTWSRVSGEIEADPAALAAGGARAAIAVDMTTFDAGDWLRNRKLRADLDVARHPTATFELTALREVEPRPDGSFAAVAEGTLRWRGHTVTLAAAGSGRLGADALDAEARFELDVRTLGVTPPRFLMLKVEDVVAVEVRLHARAA
jgi:polyisoprenoid-binding protein YceI